MASWITHTIIAGRLLESFPELDVTGFCAGNIAPDCNVENADWSGFEPPREATHWMRGEKKSSCDHQGFAEKYIRGREHSCAEERAFMLGYYAHLITDMEFEAFLRDEARVARCFSRIRGSREMSARVGDIPETWDALKKALGRPRLNAELRAIEEAYLRKEPGHIYNTVLRRITDFPDYLDYMPANAVSRKIPIMTRPPEEMNIKHMFFVSEDEYWEFIDAACRRLQPLIADMLQKEET